MTNSPNNLIESPLIRQGLSLVRFDQSFRASASFSVADDFSTGVVGTIDTFNAEGAVTLVPNTAITDQAGTNSGLFSITTGLEVTFNPQALGFGLTTDGDSTSTTYAIQLSDTVTTIDVTVRVTLTKPDQAPVAAGGLADLTLTQNVAMATVNVATDFTDADDTLTFTATGLPAGLSLSSAGSLTGTPTTLVSGQAVVITATDAGGQTATSGFQISVTDAPVVSTFTFIAPASWAAMATANRTNLETVFSTPITLSDEVHPLGDSLTDGYIDGTEYAVPMGSVIDPAQIVNEGVSGNKTQDVITRIASWTADQLSRDAALWIGTNNIADTAAQVNADIDFIVGELTGETLVMLPLYSTAMLGGDAGVRKAGIHKHLEATYGERHLDPQMMYARILSETVDAQERDEIRTGDIPKVFTPSGLDPADPEFILTDGLHVNRTASGHIYPDIARGFIALDGRGVLMKDGLTFGAEPGAAVGTVIGQVPSVGAFDEIGIGDNVGTKFTINGQGEILQGVGIWSGVEEVYVKGRQSGDTLEHMARVIVMEKSAVGDLSAPAIRLGHGFLERWDDVGGEFETGFTAAICIRSVDAVRKQILNVGRFSMNSNNQSINVAARNTSNQSVAAGNINFANTTDFNWVIFAYDHATSTVKSRLNGSNANGGFFTRTENRLDFTGTAEFGDDIYNNNLIAFKGEKELRCVWLALEYIDPDVHSDSFFNSGTGDPAFTDEALTVNGVTPAIAKLGAPWNWRSQNRGSAGPGLINPYVVSAADAPFRTA